MVIGEAVPGVKVRVGIAGDINMEFFIGQTVPFQNTFGSTLEGRCLQRLRLHRPHLSKDAAPELGHGSSVHAAHPLPLAL